MKYWLFTVFFVVAMSAMVYFLISKDQLSDMSDKRMIREMIVEDEKMIASSDSKICVYNSKQSGICLEFDGLMDANCFEVVEIPTKRIVKIQMDHLSYEEVKMKKFIGDFSCVSQVKIYESKDGVIAEFLLKSICETNVNYEEKANRVDILFSEVDKKYDSIIVIDAGHGGKDAGIYSKLADEKTVSLEIAKKVKEKLQNESFYVLLTRSNDSNPSQIERVSLANDLGADMLISLHLAASKDERVNGVNIVYNDQYYIPQFSSSDLAICMEVELRKNGGRTVNGLYPYLDHQLIVANAVVPAIEIDLGYLTNMEEARKLSDLEYQKELAQDISNGVINAYHKKQELRGSGT